LKKENPIDKFLAIENNHQLLEFKVFNKTLLLWPLIRFQVLFSALYEFSGIANPYDPVRVNYSKIAVYLLKTFKYSSFRLKNGEIIIFGSDNSNIKTKEGYFNRLSELFAKQYSSRTSIIEDSSNFDYKRPRTYGKVFAHDDVIIISRIFGRFNRLTIEDRKTINHFIGFLKNNLDHIFQDNLFWTKTEIILNRLCREYPIRYFLYKRLLKKNKTRILFIQDASYGYFRVPLIVAARDMGIKVIEFQHGMISKNHPAYNYSESLPDLYLKYLPDFYLAYGTYWKDNCRLPSSIIVIGNPYLTEIAIKTKHINKKRQLLYASGGIEPETCVKMVCYLSEQLNKFGYSIKFRPHPNEIYRLDTVYKPIIEKGILVDKGNLYDTLSESDFVFSDFSTVLFESLAFGCTPIVVESSGSNLNLNFSGIIILKSIEDIIPVLRRNDMIKIPIDSLWETQWQDNFQIFMDNNFDFLRD
jgi:hypothetical protein